MANEFILISFLTACIFLIETECNQLAYGAFGHKQYTEKLKQFGKNANGLKGGVHGSINAEHFLRQSERTRKELFGIVHSEEVDKCSEQIDVFIKAATELKPWALKAVDMIGKEPSGMLDHPTLNWLGDYEQCVGITSEPVDNGNTTVEPFDFKFCVAGFDASSLNPSSKEPFYLNIGVCYPVSCNESAVAVMSQQVTANLSPPFKNLPIAYAVCHDEMKLSGKAKAVISVCAVFAALIVFATAYDVLIQHFLNKSDDNMDTQETKAGRSRYGAVANGTSHVTTGNHMDDKTPLLDDLVLSNSQDNATSHHSHDVERIPNGSAIKESTPKYQPVLSNPVKRYIVGNVFKDVSSDISHDRIGQERNEISQTVVSRIPGRLLLAFSVYTNATKLLNTSQQAGTLTSVNGIRFISMTWVVLGHTYVFGDSYTRNYPEYMFIRLKRFLFQAIDNATFAVDTFFVLSGLLVAYLTLKEMKKRNGPKKFNWFMFYFHRFWRLTPPYMLVLMVYVPLIKYWGDGPMWSQTGVEEDECKDSWWHNLLYINNFYKKECMGWAWYLANDMQFYVISPLILIPFYYSGLAGSVICFLLVLANLITTGVISKHHNLSAAIKSDGPAEEGDSMNLIYVKPYTRIAPYAIGLFCGYILYKCNCKIDVPKGKTSFNISYRRYYQLLNMIGWAIATTFALLTLYGPYTSDGKYHMTENESAFYNACSRSAWGLAIAWVIVACATGYGGPVNKLLSWPAVIPLSRLTYCAYLVHPVVMDTYNMSQRQLLYRYELELIYEFFGHLVMSYCVAFVVSMAFEAPMMGLEKVLLKRDKRN